jgi:hypothetical protein
MGLRVLGEAGGSGVQIALFGRLVILPAHDPTAAWRLLDSER